MRRALLGLLLGTTIALMAVDMVVLAAFREHGVFVRFRPVSEQGFDELGRNETLRPLADTAFFRAEITRAGLEQPSIRDLLAWTMNEVSSAEYVEPILSAKAAFDHAQSGHGLACGPMSNIFQHVLATAGYRTRHVQLARSFLNLTDVHVTTEVLVDGRWVVYDPTFHVSYQRDGRLLGAAEIRRALRQGTHREIRPVFYGEVKYPARLEEYYIDWLPLYNNVLLMDTSPGGFWTRLPPIRFWSGPQLLLRGGRRPAAVARGSSSRPILAVRGPHPYWDSGLGDRGGVDLSLSVA